MSWSRSTEVRPDRSWSEQEPDSEPRRRPTRHHHGLIGAGRRGGARRGLDLRTGAGIPPLSENVIHGISLVIALLIVVFLHMVIGEMAPKNITISAPERTAVLLAFPFRGFILVFRP